MSFKSYVAHATADGAFTLTDPKPLVFSGVNGLIARFVLTNKTRAGSPWKLCPGELHALAFAEQLVHGDRVIIFEQFDEGALEAQQLQCVQGISTAKTEMMFTFLPLIVLRETGPITMRYQDTKRTYSEDLTLDAGVLSPQGGWRWTKPHLALGGVVLSPARLPAAG